MWRRNRHRYLLRTRIAERLPWTPKAHIGHGYSWPEDPNDYQGRMLERFAAGLPVGTPRDWDRPDPPWLTDPNWTDSA